MGSSNKHWPSMFKNSNYQNSQPGTKSSLWSIDKERNPDLKPRWNPRPEQIRILEDVFSSGMVNPSKEEICKIRAQLQEFGQVGDANVFYWFQNRKSRSKKKHKQRQPAKRNRAKKLNQNSTTPNSSSLSSNLQNDTVVNQNQTVETDFSLPTPPLFSSPVEDISLANKGIAKGYYSSDHSSSLMEPISEQNLDEIFMNCGNGVPMNDQHDQENIQDKEAAMNMIQQEEKEEEDPQLHSYGVPSDSSNNDSALPPLPSITIDDSSALPPLPPIVIDDSALPPLPPVTIDAPVADPLPITDQFQGVGEIDEEDDDDIGKCIVSINGHVFKVDKGPFNVRGFFGDEAILIDSLGQLVLTDEWGVTLNSLQHGAYYYMI